MLRLNSSHMKTMINVIMLCDLIILSAHLNYLITIYYCKYILSNL